MLTGMGQNKNTCSNMWESGAVFLTSARSYRASTWFVSGVAGLAKEGE